MRFYLLMMISTLVGVGCGHTEKSSSEHSTIKPPTPIIKATDYKATEATTTGKSSSVATKIECAVKDDSRILDLRSRGNGCELGYTKASQEGIVASSENNGLDYCENTFKKIRDRLIGAGFSCK